MKKLRNFLIIALCYLLFAFNFAGCAVSTKLLETCWENTVSFEPFFLYKETWTFYKKNTNHFNGFDMTIKQYQVENGKVIRNDVFEGGWQIEGKDKIRIDCPHAGYSHKLFTVLVKDDVLIAESEGNKIILNRVY
ncbi:MAG: hypothetical protein ACTTHG_03325 [Treponemataceae bacterium]